jgi:recombinational DNA repair protein RecR
MMDELRDYRFYAEDMHPNQVAIDYIWKRFKETNISETAFATMEEVKNVQKVYLINRSIRTQRVIKI